MIRLLTVTLALGLAGCTGGKVIPTGIAQPADSLMIPERPIKPLKKGGDLKKYALIAVHRNRQLVDKVAGLQAYARTVSGKK